MHLSELETPSVIIDLDRLEANILRLQNYLSHYGIANRPHVKTHKIPAIAHLQINAGAVGITCQKLGEAEVMAEAGIKDIFLPYNLIGAAKLERLMNLARQVRMSVTADSEIIVRGLSAAVQGAGLTLPVLVECDTGAKRCGVQSPEAAAELARLIARSPGLHFGGFMTYPNSEQLDPFMRAAKHRLAEQGLTVECVSGGGTPQMWQAHTHRELTEHRAGMYLYGDRYTLRSGAMALADCSFRVRATVVSRPTPDMLSLEGHGLITEYPEAQIYSLSEEHGHVDISRCASKPEVGEAVMIIPNHCCVVTNLANEVVGVRRGEVEVIWPVAARGQVQ
jgi:D-serine deaminase-like pyridoxal phosphate-dependent protein